ncbi:unnamed protein product [Bursaphelenchus xylophilus]|uniref:(pine wood nematode) hypothetical protein n=1 Tax=Bursaphelenchus xylophilus TaxID=6326 RepID=A0A1I7RZF5_BURXY|nr:unnamed protein product [Bursaphelenchus xylophilus]CAG9106469.1 unnamed protein product [Bursaphelenchus xylophilus]
MIQRPMLNVSSTDDYVTVLSIPDSPTNSMYLNSANYNNIPPPLHSGDSTASTSTQPTVSSDSFDGRLKSHSMDCRSSPSSPYGRRVAAAQGVVKVMNFGADPDINHDEKPSKSSLIQPNSPSKPRRRIEFDESIRPKTHYGAISQSQSESSGLSALKRDKAHKSGFFYGLEPASEEEIEEAEGAKVQKIVLSKDTMGLRTGLSVTGVPQPDSPEKLVAIEVIDIEEGSRIAVDDQLRIEDRITKINGRPVYQMSLSRARIYLHELESQEEPSISFYRPAKPTDSERETPLQYKKISVPQQKGNTSQVHEKIQLTVVKSPTGFGFGIASRTSPTDNSNIFLVTTVVPDGPAEGILMPGDRIIKINGEELADKSQPEVVQIMRECAVNSELKFEISRNTENSDTESIGSAKEETKIEIQGLDDNLEILDLKIAVNEKVGAGLGLTIKAKQTRKANGEVVEGGVFVGRILHGSAAFKDGRLKEGDRILGIETVNLLCFKRNSDAVYAFNHTVSQMPASTLYFRLLIGREIEGNSEFPCRISREEFLEWAKEAEDSAKLRKLGLPVSPTPSSTTGRSSSTNFSSQNQKSAISPPSTSHSNNINESEETLNKLRENKQGSMDEETASLTSVVPEDAFDRNAASRKSFSEKAPFGMKSPSDFESFKKIAHHRQISAPLAKPLSTPTERPSVNSLKRGGSTISRQRRRMIKSEFWSDEKTPEAPKTAPTTPQMLRKKSSNFWGIFKKSPKLEKKEIKVEVKREMPSPKSDKENEDDGNERQSHRSVSEGPSASTVPRLRSKSHHDRLEKAEDLKEKEKKRKSVFKFLQTKAEPQKSVDEISPRKVLLDQNEENLGQNSLPHHYHQRFASAQEHWMGNANSMRTTSLINLSQDEKDVVYNCRISRVRSFDIKPNASPWTPIPARAPTRFSTPSPRSSGPSRRRPPDTGTVSGSGWSTPTPTTPTSPGTPYTSRIWLNHNEIPDQRRLLETSPLIGMPIVRVRTRTEPCSHRRTDLRLLEDLEKSKDLGMEPRFKAEQTVEEESYEKKREHRISTYNNTPDSQETARAASQPNPPATQNYIRTESEHLSRTTTISSTSTSAMPTPPPPPPRRYRNAATSPARPACPAKPPVLPPPPPQLQYSHSMRQPDPSTTRPTTISKGLRRTSINNTDLISSTRTPPPYIRPVGPPQFHTTLTWSDFEQRLTDSELEPAKEFEYSVIKKKKPLSKRPQAKPLFHSRKVNKKQRHLKELLRYQRSMSPPGNTSFSQLNSPLMNGRNFAGELGYRRRSRSPYSRNLIPLPANSALLRTFNQQQLDQLRSQSPGCFPFVPQLNSSESYQPQVRQVSRSRKRQKVTRSVFYDNI